MATPESLERGPAIFRLLGGFQRARAALTPARLRMMSLVASPIQMQCVHAITRLGLPELLARGPRDAATLARDCGAHAPTLYRVLRALATWGVLVEDAQHRFALTRLGRTLLPGPGTAREVVLLAGNEALWRQYGALHEHVLTGQPAWRRDFANPFDYLAQWPEAAAAFNAAVSTFSPHRARAIVRSYDFGAFQQVVDVGGGEGGFLALLLQTYPKPRGVLFDLPGAVAGAPPRFRAAGVEDRATIVAGSFFDRVPAGGDCYTMSHVLHHWGEPEARRILGNVRAAMAPGAKLVVLDAIVPTAPVPHPGKILDLNMMVFGGLERTMPEWRALLEQAGFRVTRVVTNPSQTHAIEAVVA